MPSSVSCSNSGGETKVRAESKLFLYTAHSPRVSGLFAWGGLWWVTSFASVFGLLVLPPGLAAGCIVVASCCVSCLDVTCTRLAVSRSPWT